METLWDFLQTLFSSLRFGLSPPLNIAACQQAVDAPIIPWSALKATKEGENNQISFLSNRLRNCIPPETRNKDPTAG